MKEKIALRIAEVEAWGTLAENLESLESMVRRDMEDYTACIKEKYPDGGEGVKSCWEYTRLQDCKVKLAAYESIRATIFKVMG